MKMNKYKASGLLFIFAGVLFAAAALVGQKLIVMPLGLFFVILGFLVSKKGK